MKKLFIRMSAKIKSLMSHIAVLVYVPECVGCGKRLSRDDIFCPDCFSEYVRERESACNICGNRIDSCFCAVDDLKRHGISKHIKLLYYKSHENTCMNNMAYVLKQKHNSRLNAFLCAELALAVKKHIDLSGKEYIVTYAPRSIGAYRRFGYDHARELALGVADILSLEFRDMFVRKGSKAQKEMSRSERERNVKATILSASETSLENMRVIVIDDVVTSGATMGACKSLLKKRGAKEVVSVSVYQTAHF